MSIVIVGVTHNFAIAMSDGKVTNPKEMIPKEHYKKVTKVNKYVCVGITGNLDFFDELSKSFFYNIINKNEIKVNQLFNLLYEKSKRIKSEKHFLGDSSIVVCGVSTDNKITSLGFSTKDFIIDEQNAEGSGLAVHVLSDYPNAFKITVDNILQCGNLIKGMEDTIKYISTVDNTVNDVIFTERIDL